MFNIGDMIMYGNTGVCKVTEIGQPDFEDPESTKQYYFLEPLYQSGAIYAPIENGRVSMRAIISKDEANNLINSIPDIKELEFRPCSVQQLSKNYQAVIDTHDCTDLIKLIKAIRIKKRNLKMQNRTLGQIDKKFLKRATDLLHGELAASLEMELSQIGSYIESQVSEENTDGE